MSDVWQIELRVRDALGRTVFYTHTWEPPGRPINLTTGLTGPEGQAVAAEVRIGPPRPLGEPPPPMELGV